MNSGATPAAILDAAARAVTAWQQLADVTGEEDRAARALAEKERRERFIARLAAAHPDAMEGTGVEPEEEEDDSSWIERFIASIAERLAAPDERLSDQLEACADADAATAAAIRDFLEAPGRQSPLAPRLRAEERMLTRVSGACRQAAAVRRATKLPEVR